MAKISNLIPAASEKPEDQEEEKEKPIVLGGYFARLDILHDFLRLFFDLLIHFFSLILNFIY